MYGLGRNVIGRLEKKKSNGEKDRIIPFSDFFSYVVRWLCLLYYNDIPLAIFFYNRERERLRTRMVRQFNITEPLKKCPTAPRNHPRPYRGMGRNLTARKRASIAYFLLFIKENVAACTRIFMVSQ